MNTRKLKLLDHQFFQYQFDWLQSKARFKIGLWARQTGKDYTCAAEAVYDCYSHPKTLWLILAASERQALESLAKAKEWAQQIRLPVDDYEESAPNPGARLNSAQITFANGARILALPANPDTVRGYSANVILTEFAFHENPDAIWRAIYPSITNPLRGGQKKLRIISTPNGLRNKFATLWSSSQNGNSRLEAPNDNRSSRRKEAPNFSTTPDPVAAADSASGELLSSTPHNLLSLLSLPSASSVTPHPNDRWFRSRITIHDAIRDGLPLDAAELESALDDQDAWNQEYLCQFADASSVLLPYDLIANCESADASEFNDPQALSRTSFPLYAGIDFGRKNHLTVCWILERIPVSAFCPLEGRVSASPLSLNHRSTPFILITREVLTLKNTSTPVQLDILRPRLQRCHRISVDYTGAGIGLGDALAREFPPATPSQSPDPHARVELCQFTSALKSELFPRLRAAFEHRELLVPVSREIREDLHSVMKIVTTTGQIQYRALSTSDGHADRCTALALALRAAKSAPVSQGATSVGPGFRINYPRYDLSTLMIR